MPGTGMEAIETKTSSYSQPKLPSVDTTLMYCTDQAPHSATIIIPRARPHKTNERSNVNVAPAHASNAPWQQTYRRHRQALTVRVLSTDATQHSTQAGRAALLHRHYLQYARGQDITHDYICA